MSITYGAIYGGCYTAGYGTDNELTLTYARPAAAFTSSVGTTDGRTVTFTDATSDPHSYIASYAWDFGDSSTSTAQNPSHTYAAEGTQYTAVLTVTDIFGRRSSVSHVVQTTVPVDNGYYVPTQAAGFAYLGVTTPNSLWLCQEASGNLADSLGSLTLTANASPTYQQTAGSFTRKGVGFTQTANQRFTAASGTGPNPTTTSTVWLGLWQIGASQAGIRNIQGSAGLQRARILGTTKIRGLSTANTADGTANYASIPQIITLTNNRAASVVRVRTETELMQPTYVAAAADGAKGFGDIDGGAASINGILMWACMWSGAAAEALDVAATIAALAAA